MTVFPRLMSSAVMMVGLRKVALMRGNDSGSPLLKIARTPLNETEKLNRD